MFLSIPDSVMNSHIYWMKVFIRLEVSVEISIWLNKCLDVLNFFLNIPIDCWVVNHPFLQFYKHVK